MPITLTHIIETPAHTFTFAGRVPAALAYTALDGTPATASQLEVAQRSGPRIAGLKSVSFPTRAEAEAAAVAAGCEVAPYVAPRLLAAYEIKFKISPRARTVKSWTRFYHSPAAASESAAHWVAKEYPAGVVLSVQPVADPRGL